MGYAKEVYQKAQQELDLRRERAERTAEQRRAQLYAAIPRLAALERELSQTGLSAARAAIGGGDEVPDIIDSLRRRSLSLQDERAALLRESGFPEDFLEVQYTCSKCADTGYIGQKQCACMAGLLRRFAYERLGDSSAVRDCRFENFSLSYYPDEPSGRFQIVPRRAMEKVLSITMDYAEHFSMESESLLLCGGTGLGKTHLSLAIAYRVTQKGFGVLYASSQRLLDRLQAQQFGRAEDGNDYLGMAIGCDLLVIDDLGAEFSTSFSVASLYNLINSRINERRPTIISTNFDEKVLRERYGDRILSRLLCTYRPLQFYGEDIRMLKRFGKK